MATKEHWTVALGEYQRRRRAAGWRRAPNPLIARMVRSAQLRALDKGLPFNITQSDISIPRFCPALGVRLFTRTKGGGPGVHSPSLDRIQPHLGYVRGNVAVISMRANLIKGHRSLDQLCAKAARHACASKDLLAVIKWLRKVHPDGWMYGPR